MTRRIFRWEGDGEREVHGFYATAWLDAPDYGRVGFSM